MTCFESHQAAEFYLESLIVSITGFHPYTHDLTELIEAIKSIGVEVSDEITTACEVLTPHYILSRYPGKRAVTYTRARAERCIVYAKRIVEWVRRLADP